MTRIAIIAIAAALIVALGMVIAWKYTILALAIAAVSSLGIAAMFSKVAPGHAVRGALTSFGLLFVGPWLSLQLAAPLLFDRDSDLTRWLRESAVSGWALGHTLQHSGFFVALAVAGLLASYFLGRAMKALAVFVGALLLFCFGPRLLEANGFFLSDFFFRHDPASRHVVVALIVLGVVGIVRLLATSNHQAP